MLNFITSPSRLGLCVYLCVVFGISFLAVTLRPEKAPAAIDHESDIKMYPIPENDTDTEFAAVADVEPAKPQIDARLVGQLARGMRRIVDDRDNGLWGFCGEQLDADAQIDVSTTIAYHIVSNMQSIGADHISPWGVLATAYNESGFDACALGLGPRRWAYRKGLLKPRKRFVSHSSDEVLRVVKSPEARRQFAASGFDLGLCQVLTRFYRDEDEAEMLTIAGSTRICVLEMKARADRNKTAAPWLYWRGSATPWYHGKIRRWAKRMGAPRGEV